MIHKSTSSQHSEMNVVHHFNMKELFLASLLKDVGKSPKTWAKTKKGFDAVNTFSMLIASLIKLHSVTSIYGIKNTSTLLILSKAFDNNNDEKVVFVILFLKHQLTNRKFSKKKKCVSKCSFPYSNSFPFVQYNFQWHQKIMTMVKNRKQTM